MTARNLDAGSIAALPPIYKRLLGAGAASRLSAPGRSGTVGREGDLRLYTSLPKLRRYAELDGKTFLVCVGAMKCATSWIHDYLGSLNDVAVSPLKELHFFSTKFPAYALGDMETLALQRLAFHIKQPGEVADNLRRRPTFQASVDRVQMMYDDDAYFGHFARLCGPDDGTFCDITPAYSVLGPAGFAYLRDFCASQDISLRLLYVMRDPVDRLWSQLRHMTQTSKATDYVTDWAKALQSLNICARADYRGTVTDLDETFPDGDVLYLFYEDLFESAALKRLCAHAGAEYGPAEKRTRRNETELKVEMPADARAAALELLAPQYAFCRERFGDDVPKSWRA